MTKSLSLGTANFGKKYNFFTNLKIKNKEIKNIFLFLEKNKIFELDTALNYHNEKQLRLLRSKKWNITTKIDIKNYAKDQNNWKKGKNYLTELKKKLKIKSLYATLIHISNLNDFKSKNLKKLFKSLLVLKKNKVIKKIGFSIYDPVEAELILKNFKIDIIQLPVNVFDRRFENLGYLKKFKKNKIEIQARSIFLQGFLLKNKMPKKFKIWKNEFREWQKWVKKKGVTKLQACIAYVKQLKEVDKIIIGFENKKQLEEIVRVYKEIKKNKKTNFQINNIHLNLIDPRRWR
tara:strand:+ start:999 stop:1868 length:870 start_codon:yes stop_codon:yes gene_type:complete